MSTTDRVREDLDVVLRAALAAVDPAAAVRRALKASDLEAAERVIIVGAGKAGVAMARAAVEIVGSKLAGGVMAVPAAPMRSQKPSGFPEPAAPMRSHRPSGFLEPATPDPPVAGVACVVGGHPLPDAGSLTAGAACAEILKGAGPHDLVLALISGGGSALLELPVNGISLEDLRLLTDLALRSGAPIEALNRMRWRLSQIKGGGLLRLAAPARVLGLILSDVIGNPLEIIASGPTVQPEPGGETAWAIAQRYGLAERLPAYIGERLRSAPAAAAAAPVENRIIGSNRLAAEAALEAARSLGYAVRYLGDDWRGEAREAGRRFAREVLKARWAEPMCVIAGGETTVRVVGKGLGGRNQEFALAAALELDGQRDVSVAAFGTDGVDGPTDAAGAVVTGETLGEARRLALNPQAYLDDNDAYRFHRALDTLLMTGPTGTNVNDLMIGLTG